MNMQTLIGVIVLAGVAALGLAVLYSEDGEAPETPPERARKAGM